MEDAPDYCPRCARWHTLPWCNHNAEAPCAQCGNPVGYRFTGDDGEAAGDGTICSRCYWPQTSKRILVCGGRDFRDQAIIFGALDAIHRKHGISCIIAGSASGADHMAANWARARCVTLREFPADWDTHGKAAGPIRNRQMLEEGKPDAVVAFPGGRGTADMVRAARKAGLIVWNPVTC